MKKSLIPRVKIITEDVISPNSVCGDHWDKEVGLASKDNSIELVLPSLGDQSQISEYDPIFCDEIIGDAERVFALEEKYRHLLSPEKKELFFTMMERSRHYIDSACTIIKTWERGFQSPSCGDVAPWPLGDRNSSGRKDAVKEGHRRDEINYEKLVYGALRNLRCAEEMVTKSVMNHERSPIKSIRGRRKFLSDFLTENTEPMFHELYMGPIEL